MAADPLAELPGWGRELLASSRVARLGLLDGSGRPRVLPVTFALHDGRIWTAIDSKPKRDPGAEPARLRFIRRRPEVALTADRYSDDWRRLAWVQLLGRAAIEPASEQPGAIAALRGRYRPYRDDPPPGPLIAIAVERALSWRAAGE